MLYLQLMRRWLGITEWPETNKWIWKSPLSNEKRCRVCQRHSENPFVGDLCLHCYTNMRLAEDYERLYANNWDETTFVSICKFLKPPSVMLEVDHWKIPCKLEDFRPSEYIYADATISANRRFCKHDYYKKEKIELLL